MTVWGLLRVCSNNNKHKMEQVAPKDFAEPNFLLCQMLHLFCPGLHYIFQVIGLPALVLLFHFVLFLFSDGTGITASEDWSNTSPWPIPGTSGKFVMHQLVAISILQRGKQKQSINKHIYGLQLMSASVSSSDSWTGHLTSAPQLTAQCKKVNGVIWDDWA